LPPFPASVMDGYAVIASDCPGTYPVLGLVSAGTLSSLEVVAGSIAQITTGSPIPRGANAVVMVRIYLIFLWFVFPYL
jgi:gephyrin